MSDIHGAAAPESSPAPVSEVAVDLPNPISTEAQPEPEVKAEPKPAKVEAKPDKPISAREALEKAALKVEKENPKIEAKDAKTEKAEPAKGPVKDEKTGKFTSTDPAKIEAKEAAKVEAKPSYTAGDPPARFTPDVKGKWAELPENVRGEVSRMERELTQGYEKHKVAAERDATLNEFHEMAKQSGKDLRSVVAEYVNTENILRKDVVGGLDAICQKLGVSLKDVAAHVMGQPADQTASKQDATIRELRQQNTTLETRLNRLEGGFHQQREQSTLTEINKFAQEHPRFEELAEDIAVLMRPVRDEKGQIISPGRAKDLPEAYQLAERLNPAPAKALDPVPAKDTVIDLSAQTEKGQKSINGSPGSGSFPAATKPSNSIKEALRKAAAAAG